MAQLEAENSAPSSMAAGPLCSRLGSLLGAAAAASSTPPPPQRRMQVYIHHGVR